MKKYLPFLVICIVLVIGILTYTIFKKKSVTDFESCQNAGHPVMVTYPAQCVANGHTYTEPTPTK